MKLSSLCDPRLLGLSIGLLLAVAPGAARGEAPLVIVLCWDGVRHDYPDRGRLPGLERMASAGVRAERLTPTFPANTFPNTVSLATGASAGRHGIVDNRFRDRVRGRFDYGSDASWLEAEPLWVAAERQGLRAATYFWVGSETDWRGTGATYRHAPFDADVGEAEKVDEILRWLDLPPESRPSLIMQWWNGTDDVGHLKGPSHPDVFHELAGQDAELQRLLSQLDRRGAWPHTTLIVVSDHGMTETSESIDVEALLSAARIEGEVMSSAAVAHVFLENQEDLSRAERTLGVVSGLAVHRRGALPSSLGLSHANRNGDLVLLVDPPIAFRRTGVLEELFISAVELFGWRRGLHGFAPDHPDMGAIFFALGRGVPVGRPPREVRSIDVAPTVAALLGIAAPSGAEGSVIAGFAESPRSAERRETP